MFDEVGSEADEDSVSEEDMDGVVESVGAVEVVGEDGKEEVWLGGIGV